MSILSGMDIERIQSDININFYIQDVIANKASGYVMPNDELFAKVFSQKEVYRSITVMYAVATSIGNISVSDTSREFFRQKAIEYVDEWGNSNNIAWYILQAFCAIGASLYSIKDKISIEWAKTSAMSAGMFNQYPLFLYLCGVISKTQWFRSKQGFVGDNPDPIASDNFYMWDRYDASGSHMYAVFNAVGAGDSMTELTLGGINFFAYGLSSSGIDLGYDYRHVTWGKDSEMRRVSNEFLASVTNKNLVKLMIPKYREYLAPIGTSNYGGAVYKMDTETSKIYQPSIIEFIGIKKSPSTPSIPQTGFSRFDGITPTDGDITARVIKSGSTAQNFALRDCDGTVNSANQLRRYGSTTGSISVAAASSMFVPVFFDLQLPMWCM